MDYSVSIHYDRRLAPDDIAGSRAHVRGLGRGGLADPLEGGFRIPVVAVPGLHEAGEVMEVVGDEGPAEGEEKGPHAPFYPGSRPGKSRRWPGSAGTGMMEGA